MFPYTCSQYRVRWLSDRCLVRAEKATIYDAGMRVIRRNPAPDTGYAATGSRAPPPDCGQRRRRGLFHDADNYQYCRRNGSRTVRSWSRLPSTPRGATIAPGTRIDTPQWRERDGFPACIPSAFGVQCSERYPAQFASIDAGLKGDIIAR